MNLQALFKIMSPAQIRSVLLSEKRKIAIWYGAVSSGKTIASLFAFLFAILTVPEGEIIVIVGKTLQSIERNVIIPLQNPRLFGQLSAFTVHTVGSSYATILGRKVELIGANNVSAEERIRGGTFHLVYVDEATLLLPNFWSMLITRLRTKGARLIATTNPGSRNHWLKINWIDRALETNLIAFHFTMADNPSLTPEYIAEQEATYADPILHMRFIRGLWTAAEGAVYQDWNPIPGDVNDRRNTHVIPWEQTPALSMLLGVGMDWGTTNASTGLLLGVTAERNAAGRPSPRLILVDEWRYDSRKTKRRLTPEQLAVDYASWYSGDGKGFAVSHTPFVTDLTPRYHIVDPAAPAFRLALRDQGFWTEPASNEVVKGIGTVSNLISSHYLLSTTRCTGFNAEVTEYVWDSKKADEGIDYPVTVADHSLDGARYIIHTTRTFWGPILRDAYKLAA